MDDTNKSLPTGVTGELIPDLPWLELADWARSSVSKENGPFWYRGADDPIVILGALSQLIDGLVAGVVATDIANRPPLLAAKQLMTLNQLCQGRLHLLVDESSSSAEIEAELNRVATAESTAMPVTQTARTTTSS